MVLNPSDFSTTLIRITDLATGGQSAVHQGYTVSCDASSEENSFNVNEDHFKVCPDEKYFSNCGDGIIRRGRPLGALALLRRVRVHQNSPLPSPRRCTTLMPAGRASQAVRSTTWQFSVTTSTALEESRPAIHPQFWSRTFPPLAALQPCLALRGTPSACLSVEIHQTLGGWASTPTADVYAFAWHRNGDCDYWNTSTRQVYHNGTLLGTITANR